MLRLKRMPFKIEITIYNCKLVNQFGLPKIDIFVGLTSF